MRTRSSGLLLAATGMVAVLVAGCLATGYGVPLAHAPQARTSRVAPLVQTIAPPEEASPRQPAAGVSELTAHIQQATADAAAAGADLSVAVLDRATGQLVSNGERRLVGIASVAKLFIADDLLLAHAQDKTQLSPDDRAALDAMLRASDDNAAENFWNQRGGEAIITAVARRYGLTSTTPPSDGRWWNTMSSTSDLLRYYDMLLSGTGGLPAEQADIILGDLAESTAIGVDGYPQRFGIPDGLDAEPVAVKQGWMCCIGNDWMHLSTGVIGPDRRYIMVIESLQPSDDATARATITQAVKTMFPGGRI
ncbi:hypothetical protein [Mycobacterium sp.]|uniref:hypothetical protein n=1 Tax=Mycobacterium sp. TaxID=1785 RepID=UPI00127A3A68|nr:hypothetical protein [Mycobacterium sp.]KAA8964260.1 MAG: serine hydrolase [Mycobacterium sp.]